MRRSGSASPTGSRRAFDASRACQGARAVDRRTSTASCAGCAASAFARSCLTVRSRSTPGRPISAPGLTLAARRESPDRGRDNIGGLGRMSSSNLKTGKPAFEQIFGMSVFDWRAQERRARRAVRRLSRQGDAGAAGPIVASARLCRARGPSPILAAAMAGCSLPCSAPIRDRSGAVRPAATLKPPSPSCNCSTLRQAREIRGRRFARPRSRCTPISIC